MALVATLATVTLREDTYVVSPPTAPDGPNATGVDTVGAADALRVLTRAIRRRDPASAASVAAPGSEGLLGSVVEVARAADIVDVDLRYLDDADLAEAPDSWTAVVAVQWAFSGFDRSPARSEVAAAFRTDATGRTSIVRLGGSGLRTPVWLTDGVEVRRGAGALILTADGRPDRYRRLADRAVGVVRAAVPAWRTGLVVEVPRALAGLDAALAAPEGEYARIAAVTASADGSEGRRAPVHVFVNPEVFAGLRGAGAEVVMSHEAAHVALRGPQSLAPTWLVEGIADYVALRDTTLPLRVTARQIGAQVRRDGVPRALPDRAAFDTQSPHLGAVYEGAWQLCVTLADHGGEEALLGLYRRLSRGGRLGPALRAGFGWTPRELLVAWQRRLSDVPA